tara:strand:- start:1244 stop:1498 length:255 start_codon:yes stop_codon:yes gene_type:complete
MVLGRRCLNTIKIPPLQAVPAKVIVSVLNINHKMTENIKLYIINGSTIGVTTFTHLEHWLKIILLVVTIGYTITKWFKVKKEDE